MKKVAQNNALFFAKEDQENININADQDTFSQAKWSKQCVRSYNPIITLNPPSCCSAEWSIIEHYVMIQYILTTVDLQTQSYNFKVIDL